MSVENSLPFTYTLSGTSLVTVVHLSGSMNNKAVMAIEQLRQELRTKASARYFLFHFAQVTQVSGDAVQLFTQVQLEIRGNHSLVYIAGLNSKLEERLLMQGVVRKPEIFPGLKDALSAIASRAA
jgi:anti-anti-sigma regulatory factor